MNVFGLILDKEKTIERVFKICQFYNVKNVDLAELMYTTEVEISNWKTGKRFPDWDKILLFAYVFEISLDDLIVRKKIDGNNEFDDIREKELVMLLTIIESLYNSKGIYSTTTIEELENLRATDYPIFSDLKRFIPEYKKKENSPEKIRIINQLDILISRFLTGTDAYLFDGYTTIDLSNDLIAFNMKELLYSGNERLINTQTINLLTYLSNAIVSNKINNDKLQTGSKKPICIR